MSSHDCVKYSTLALMIFIVPLVSRLKEQMMIEKLNIRAAMMNSQTVVTTFHTLFIRDSYEAIFLQTAS